MVAPNGDCSAGSVTLTTVPSMNAILEPSIVAAIIQHALLAECLAHEPERMRASSQAGLAKGGIVHSRKERAMEFIPGEKDVRKRW
jgi:hypothetical protein